MGHAYSKLELPSNYTGVEELGAGGMGVVYKAYDTAMSREVAIKVIRDADLTQAELKRFVGEAKALGRLAHPNIIKVHSIGQLKSGQPFIVLEYFAGDSLNTVLERDGKLSTTAATQLFHQMTSALQHAHSNGVVHRDIKPSNVMVSVDQDGNRTFRLLDFGIARFVDTAKTQGLTKTGAMLGSPVYASPEQCNGTKVDHRSDIYSLGCMIYEAVAGTPPFVGDNSIELMISHCSADVPPIRAVAPDTDVSSGLERIIRRCLQKSRDDRFSDASDLLAALYAGDTTLSDTPTAPVRKARIDKSRLTAPVLVVTVLLASAAFAAVLLNQQTPTTSLDLPASRLADRAQTLKAELEGKSPTERAEIHREAADLFEQATLHAKPTDPQRADYYFNLGHENLSLARDALAEKSFRSSIELLGPNPEVNRKQQYMLCLTALATSLAQQHKNDEALAELEKCLPLTPPNSKGRAKTLLRMGQQNFHLKHFAQAEKYYLASKKEYEDSDLQDNGEYASVMIHLGQLQKDMGRFKEARQYALKAKQISVDIRAAEEREQAEELLKQVDSAENRR